VLRSSRNETITTDVRAYGTCCCYHNSDG